MGAVMRMFAIVWLMFFPAMGYAQTASSPNPVLPTFYQSTIDDSKQNGVFFYRPVVNATGTIAIFERTPVGAKGDSQTELYYLYLPPPSTPPLPPRAPRSG
jgi:hypothetical protein